MSNTMMYLKRVPNMQNFEPYKKVSSLFSRNHMVAYLSAKAFGPKLLYDLEYFSKEMGLSGFEDLGIATIGLRNIIGTYGVYPDCDWLWRPLRAAKLREIWIGTALNVIDEPAVRERQTYNLTPKVLYRFGEGAFVIQEDTLVLLSVLKALGVPSIRTHIVGPINAGIPAPTLEMYAFWQQQKSRSRA